MPSARERRILLPDLPLAWLVAAGYVTCLVATLLLLTLVLHQLLARYLWFSTQMRLVGQARSALGLTEGGRDQRLALSDLARREPHEVVRLLAEAGLTSRILDPQGRTVAQAGPGVTGMPLPSPEHLVRARNGRMGRRLAGTAWLAEGPRRRMLLVLVPLGPPRGSPAWLQLGAPWRFAEELNTELGRMLLWTGLGALLLGLGTSLVIGRLLARPLQHLAATAHRVAGGDLQARAGLPAGRNEISAVAAAFDEMVARLEQSFAAQKRFVANASHELKTPLTSISGMAELLEQASPEEQRRALGILQKEADRMGRLIEELLVLSRAEEQPRTENRTTFEASGLLRELVERTSLVDPSHPVELEIRDPLWVRADRDGLVRVLQNLLDNARKHSPSGAPVKVEGKALPGQVEILVRDRGPGIPEQDLPHVFERFYRADPSRARSTGGSGLGLAIVREVLQAHQGQAYLRNHPEGGLEALIRLPSANLQDHDPPSSAASLTMRTQPTDTEEVER